MHCFISLRRHSNPRQSAYAVLLSYFRGHCPDQITILSFLISSSSSTGSGRFVQSCRCQGDPPLVYMNPRLLSVRPDWFVIGGGKAPDGGLGFLGPIRNRLLSSGGKLHVEGHAPLFLHASKDHPGNFGVSPHNVSNYAFLRCKLLSDNQGRIFYFHSLTLLTPFI